MNSRQESAPPPHSRSSPCFGFLRLRSNSWRQRIQFFTLGLLWTWPAVALVLPAIETPRFGRIVSIWSWGFLAAGTPGSDSSGPCTAPVQVPALTGVAAVAAGPGWTTVLRQDGTLWAWGDNTQGQLGDGTTTDRPAPVRVVGLTQASALSAGEKHTLALRQDGSVWTWGDNASGQLGHAKTERRVPVQVAGLAN